MCPGCCWILLVNLFQSQSPQTASLWFSFEVMPGMYVLISACRVFKLSLFSLFCGVFELLVQGWSGILFILSEWMRSLACLLLSSASDPSVFSISAMAVVFIPPRIVRKPIFCARFCVYATIKKSLVTYFTYLPSHRFTDSPTDLLTDRMNE